MVKNDFSISAELSTRLKSIAIVLMVVHHLFGLAGGHSYIALLHIHGLPVEMLVGRFGKICVAMFMFLSGYGFYCTLNFAKYSFKKNLDKIFRFYLQYLVVFALFIPYLLYSGHLHWDTAEFIENLLTFKSTYNGAWWFAGVYINILIFYPIFIYTTRDKPLRIILLSVILFGIAGLIEAFPNVYLFASIAFLKKTLIWQVIFFQGYLFAQNSLFKYLRFIKTTWVCIAAIIIVFLLRTAVPVRFSIYKVSAVVLLDFFLAPIFIIALKGLLEGKSKFLPWLGRHSTNIWLTHFFFIDASFSFIGYYPKVSVAVLLFTLLLSIASSYIINFILGVLPTSGRKPAFGLLTKS